MKNINFGTWVTDLHDMLKNDHLAWNPDAKVQSPPLWSLADPATLTPPPTPPVSSPTMHGEKCLPRLMLLRPQDTDAYPRFRDRSHKPQEPARRRSTPNVAASRLYSPPLAIFAPTRTDGHPRPARRPIGRRRDRPLHGPHGGGGAGSLS